MYKLPLFDLQNGPLTSIPTLSYGAPTTLFSSELLFFYISSYTPMSCICTCILYQKCISLTLDRVFFIYKCPPVTLFCKSDKTFPTKTLGITMQYFFSHSSWK